MYWGVLPFRIFIPMAPGLRPDGMGPIRAGPVTEEGDMRLPVPLQKGAFFCGGG